MLITIIYLAFISLGLPDGLLGAAWPSVYPEIGVRVSAMGILSIIIHVGTILSSLLSHRLTRSLGTGKVTALSVALTAAALLGFASSRSFAALCLWAIPYGLGAGSVDAALNNYVALHCSSRHMSWLHCMWGIGAASGPWVLGMLLTGGAHWSLGYRAIGFLQIGLTAVLFLSLPLWKAAPGQESGTAKALTLREVFAIPGAREILLTFLGYCALEASAGQWASSYLVLSRGFAPETAATFGSLFYLGITLGRGLNGFLTFRFTDSQLIRMGFGIIGLGLALLLLPLGSPAGLIGLMLVGLGCAPVYPCIIHSTPALFGAEHSQALIGVQMASAYTGSCLLPPLFGVLGRHISMGLLPFWLLALLSLMTVMYARMLSRIDN